MSIDKQGNNHVQRLKVCLIPGLAAKSSIFEPLRLASEHWELYHLDWIEPLPGEDLTAYTRRLVSDRDLSSFVLVAASLGVLLANEIARQFRVEKIILISSVKSAAEIPGRFRLLRYRWLLNSIPFHWVGRRSYWRLLYNLGLFRNRLKRYDRYMGLVSPVYLRWTLKHFILEDWGLPDGTEVVHIHGNRDTVFPISRIWNCIPVEDGSHAVILEQPDRIRSLLQKHATASA